MQCHGVPGHPLEAYSLGSWRELQSVAYSSSRTTEREQVPVSQTKSYEVTPITARIASSRT